MKNEFDEVSCTCSHGEVMEMKAQLGLKISKMLKSFGAVSEDGENTFSNYGYISSNKMVGILREHLYGHNLSIIPEVVGYKETVTVDAKEKNWIRTVVEMNFEIVDTETGYSVEKKFFGADQDTGGKSFGQAVTEATKRFYFKLFQVSSSDEKDPDGKTSIITGDKKPKAKDGGTLTKDQVPEFYDFWNGKIYKGNTVYWNDLKYKLTDEQAEWLKGKEKYKES
jgi:hypothetical protein